MYSNNIRVISVFEIALQSKQTMQKMKVDKAGDTMEGVLDMNGNNIKNFYIQTKLVMKQKNYACIFK